MLPVSRGAVVNTLATTALAAILYRYWLVTPVLQYVSIGRWRLIAIVVATACGGVLSLFRLSVSSVACGSIAGLLLGGTCAACQAPHDVPFSRCCVCVTSGVVLARSNNLDEYGLHRHVLLCPLYKPFSTLMGLSKFH